jgi:hypothetical protein
MFAYRVGFPGWKVAARAGWPVRLRIDVHHDPEVNSYWTTSSDLNGLVVTGATLNEVRNEARLASESLLDRAMNDHAVQATPELRFRDAALCAA